MKLNFIFSRLFKPVETEEDDPALGSEDEITEESSEGGDPEEDENNSDEEDSEEDEEDDSVDPIKVQRALEIFDALNNPQTSAGMLAFLNAQLGGKGITVTKDDLKDIKVEDLLKEGFGEEYSFLNEKLTPAFTKAMNALVEKATAPLTQQISNLQQQIAATAISNALDPIIEEMGAEEFDKIAEPLNKMMQRYPNQGQPLKAYLKDMIKLVKSDRNSPERVNKIQKNVREARRNLANKVEPTKVKMGSKTPSIREAVQLAMQGKQVEE